MGGGGIPPWPVFAERFQKKSQKKVAALLVYKGLCPRVFGNPPVGVEKIARTKKSSRGRGCIHGRRRNECTASWGVGRLGSAKPPPRKKMSQRKVALAGLCQRIFVNPPMAVLKIARTKKSNRPLPRLTQAATAMPRLFVLLKKPPNRLALPSISVAQASCSSSQLWIF